MRNNFRFQISDFGFEVPLRTGLPKTGVEIPNSEFRIPNSEVNELVDSVSSTIPQSPDIRAPKIRNLNPQAAAEADHASSEGGGHEPPAGDGATRRPKADSKFEIRNWSGLRERST
jgi:hypothetical protein